MNFLIIPKHRKTTRQNTAGICCKFQAINLAHVSYPAGFLQGLAAACEQVAAVLIRQQKEPEQQQQQQQQQRQAALLLARLSSPAAVCCLLHAWNSLTLLWQFQDHQDAGRWLQFGVTELLPTLVPVCTLVAAAAVLLGGSRPSSSCSDSSSSSSFWECVFSATDLWQAASAAAKYIGNCALVDCKADGFSKISS
jgi:hypothetical protein